MDERVRADCVANARALAPMIEAAAPRIESGRGLPADLVDALHEARLYRMLVPRSLGGEEIPLADYVAAIEQIARVDASTAWCIGQTSVCSTVSKVMKPEVAARIFRDDSRGVLAWGPSGNGKAIVDGDGYRVSGVWPFASGSRQATWLAAHCIVYEPAGEPRLDPAGKPLQKTMLLPREQATIDDVWHVVGLKGTGSDTYTFTDAFVPGERAIGYHALDPAERREHGPLYAFTIYQLFGLSFAAVALGIARAMLDAFCALAQAKTPMNQTVVLRDNAVAQSQVGVMQTQLATARAAAFSAINDIWQAAQARSISLDQRVQLRMACINLSQQARQVAEASYLAAGATAIFESNPFERRLRDMHAVSQQAQAQSSIYESIGRYFLGLPANTRLI
jgi:alkylation response protein AidB-like acyl-CoA dehydrogenase